MREIKFRAWDKDKKIFVPQGDIIFSDYGDDRIIVNPNCQEYIGDMCHDYYKESRFEIVQYTGLKDKNGIEIYEGDIVKWGHIEGRTESWHRVAEVELFPSLQFRIINYIDSKTLEFKKGDNYVFGFSNFIYKDTHKSLEIIGNIYENHELLES